MPKYKNTRSVDENHRRLRSCKNKEVILTGSNKSERKSNTRGEKTSKTVKSSTPVKSSPNEISKRNIENDSENLHILLSPIGARGNTKEKHSKEVKCRYKTRKRLAEIFDDNSAPEPKWKQTRRRTYTRASDSSESSVEVEDPFSLFNLTQPNEFVISPIKALKPKKKAQPQHIKTDKKFEKEFQDWCRSFSEDLELAAQTELIIE